MDTWPLDWRVNDGDLDIAVVNRAVDLTDRADVARVGAVLGVRRIVTMTQMHGAEVAWVGVGEEPPPRADALLTDTPGVAVVARAADCLPVALACGDAVGAVHAGRAGMTAGVAAAAVEALRERTGQQQVRAWFGPCICGSCYEVPAELAAEVERLVPGSRSRTSWGTDALDIAAGVAAQLRDLGVEVHPRAARACTFEEERFFSHRRSDTGRHGIVVVRHG
ncbi:MAG: polyphenol oxidase family protein [Aeromicrobium sp.]|uniref:polyphenol oxidase family protein n=1 Tax=Aeromicrobium sp. TaxID=1871063 RepID=UPI0039E65630